MSSASAAMPMQTRAVVLAGPGRLGIESVQLVAPGPEDVVVDVEWSGISTGTERLLYTGTMPSFPGMGYPLVPGYESVGRVTGAGPDAHVRIGERVFVPGARCFGELRGLFGGAAARLVVPAAKVLPLTGILRDDGVLLALAATAWHALETCTSPPGLIVGHGVLGRLIARLAVARGGAPVVWERNAARRGEAQGYTVVDPDSDTRRDYACILDASGDAGLLDALIGRLAHGGEVVLAGFYERPLSFAFPPAFMREARLRIASEFRPEDLGAVLARVAGGHLSLAGLITHRCAAGQASEAYRTAFEDPACLKMVLDWRST